MDNNLSLKILLLHDNYTRFCCSQLMLMKGVMFNPEDPATDASVVRMLQLDYYIVDEACLLQFVFERALYQLGYQNNCSYDPETDSMVSKLNIHALMQVRKLIQPFLQYIRIHSFTTRDLHRLSIECQLGQMFNICDSQYVVANLRCILAKELKKVMTKCFSPIRRERPALKCNNFWVPGCSEFTAPDTGIDYYGDHTENEFCVEHIESDAIELGIAVQTQVKPKEATSDTYQEKLTIIFRDDNDNVAITKYTNVVYYDTVIDVPYKTPQKLVKTRENLDFGVDTHFHVKVLFHVTGKYPTTYDGILPERRGQFHNYPNVKFRYHNKFICYSAYMTDNMQYSNGWTQNRMRIIH
jgi:hypothetical protein